MERECCVHLSTYLPVSGPKNSIAVLFFCSHHFGITQVDFEDPRRTRTPKISSTFFKHLIENNTIPKIIPGKAIIFKEVDFVTFM